ncbi:MAG: Uma2 family endonuclease [Chloroflexota bacterium]|nr:Uma2 family endonuclease [Chloroflexota bacterium]
MAVIHRISEQEYQELALAEPRWELWDGEPREKPGMSSTHEDIAAYLSHLLQSQLDRKHWRLSVNGAKTRLSGSTYFIPDVVVVPAASVIEFRDDPRHLAAHASPLPLVVEVWSRTTGSYDFERKLTSYRERGDAEIWYIHPYKRTLTVWRRQPDGSYAEARYGGGLIPVASLPGVVIDLDALLA